MMAYALTILFNGFLLLSLISLITGLYSKGNLKMFVKAIGSLKLDIHNDADAQTLLAELEDFKA